MARKQADIARQMRREIYLRDARAYERVSGRSTTAVRRDMAQGMALEMLRYAILDANPLQQVTDGR